MKVRLLLAPVIAALGLSVAQAQEPARLPISEPNQQLADAIAARLSGTTGADVTIVAVNGTVTLSGTTKDAAQKDAILRQTRTTKGVMLVRDAMTVGNVVQVQGQDAPAALPPVAAGPRVSAPFASSNYPAANNGPMIEPMPMGMAGGGGFDMQAPPLPGHAWPTYAPYPNISRVAYPEAYAYNQFPFIGPYYPFPKVPMGWRSVNLKWEDGHWFLGRTSTPHDYWRVRFW